MMGWHRGKKGEIEKLIAYTPVHVFGKVWSIAVCAPANEVEAITRNVRRNDLYTWGFVVFVMTAAGVFFSISFYRWANSLGREIEARKQAEEVLKEYSEKLEEKVEKRTKDLKDAQEQLVRRGKLATLGQMAGSVSHELRNPLGVISNAVFYLNTVLDEADENTKEYLEIISSEVRTADKIVSDLLDFSRVKSVEREDVAVSDLVAQVLEKQPAPENVQVTTSLPSDLPPVVVDPGQIGQVLTNLVTNACQAMPPPVAGRLIISAMANKTRVNLSIADTGRGISEENMAKLFEPLFTTRARGIGLGLAVSKNMVESIGGNIEVQSEEGKGSTFTLILPAKKGLSER